MEKYKVITGVVFNEYYALSLETLKASYRFYEDEYYFRRFEYVLIKGTGKYYDNTVGFIVEPR